MDKTNTTGLENCTLETLEIADRILRADGAFASVAWINLDTRVLAIETGLGDGSVQRLEVPEGFIFEAVAA